MTALTEDTIALIGIVLAFVGLLLTQVTGNPMYDGIAALLIGLLLMGFAVALAWENKRLLLGESLPAEEERRLYDIVERSDGVTDVVDLRSVFFGPKHAVITANVAFEKGLSTEDIDEHITDMERALRDANGKIATVYIEPEV